MGMSHKRRMSRSPDGETSEGLLMGTLGPQEAPTEWRPVAELLTLLRTLPASAPGLQAEATGGEQGDDRHRQTVQAMAAILAEAPAQKAWRRHLRAPFRPSVPRPLNVYRVRLATVLVAASLAFLLGLASAGALPRPAQNAISVALSKFGITIPRDHGEPKTTPVGPDLSGPAKKGLCNAFFSGNGNEEAGKVDSGSVAFQNLQEAAEEAGQSVKDFCAEVLEVPATSSGSYGHGEGHGKGHAKAKGHGKAKGHDPKSTEPNVQGHGSGHSSNGNANGHSNPNGSD